MSVKNDSHAVVGSECESQLRSAPLRSVARCGGDTPLSDAALVLAPAARPQSAAAQTQRYPEPHGWACPSGRPVGWAAYLRGADPCGAVLYGLPTPTAFRPPGWIQQEPTRALQYYRLYRYARLCRSIQFCTWLYIALEILIYQLVYSHAENCS